MKNEKDIHFENPELLTRFLRNEVTPEEKQEVEIWLNQSVKNREELGQIRKMLESVDDYYLAGSFNSEDAFQKVMQRISPKSRVIPFNITKRLVISKFYKYAAILIVAILLGTAGYYFGFMKQSAAEFTEIASTEKQVISEYTLPDGSVVALNNNSKLVYPNKFTGNTREVTIYGEAFFDVKPDATKPFIINAGNAQVRVVGTSFNVSAYPGSETVEVVVATGKVQVSGKSVVSTAQTSLVMLEPGEKGTLFNFNSLVEKTENTNPNYLSWKTHDFVFEDMPLGEVFSCLEKTYHVNIAVNQPEINNLKLNAHFEKKSIGFILDVVKLTFNLDLTGENDQFAFSGRKQS